MKSAPARTVAASASGPRSRGTCYRSMLRAPLAARKLRVHRAVNRGKRELRDASARLLGAWNKAADDVAAAVEKGDLKASLLLLRVLAGSFGVVHVIGAATMRKSWPRRQSLPPPKHESCPTLDD